MASEAHESAVWLLGWRREVSAVVDGRIGGAAFLLSPQFHEASPRISSRAIEPCRILLAECSMSGGSATDLVLACACAHLVPFPGAAPAS